MDSLNVRLDYVRFAVETLSVDCITNDCLQEIIVLGSPGNLNLGHELQEVRLHYGHSRCFIGLHGCFLY